MTREINKMKAIHDALEFYAKLDCQAGVPPQASPAMVALDYAKEMTPTQSDIG